MNVYRVTCIFLCSSMVVNVWWMCIMDVRAIISSAGVWFLHYLKHKGISMETFHVVLTGWAVRMIVCLSMRKTRTWFNWLFSIKPTLRNRTWSGEVSVCVNNRKGLRHCYFNHRFFSWTSSWFTLSQHTHILSLSLSLLILSTSQLNPDNVSNKLSRN